MNRGAGRRAIFLARHDAVHFLRLLGEGVERSQVEVHAYCLMGNHYHVLVHCPAGGLSELMHRLGSMYTRYLNHRLGSDGPIFRGRFRSLLVDDERYLLAAARYIHRNPLDLRPPVGLVDYEWSSLGDHLGRRTPPTWLSTATMVDLHGDRSSLEAFVTDAVPPRAPPLEWALDTAIAVGADAVELPHLRRTIAVLALDVTEGALRSGLARYLGNPTKDARRMAVVRARRRAEAHPELWSVVEEFVRIANG